MFNTLAAHLKSIPAKARWNTHETAKNTAT